MTLSNSERLCVVAQSDDANITEEDNEQDSDDVKSDDTSSDGSSGDSSIDASIIDEEETEEALYAKIQAVQEKR